jgi:hypothetical protein
MKRFKWTCVLTGAIVGGLVPLFVIWLLEVSDENMLAVFIYGIYLFLEYPIVVFVAGQGVVILIWEMVYWLFLGALAGFVFFAIRTRRQRRAT